MAIALPSAPRELPRVRLCPNSVKAASFNDGPQIPMRMLPLGMSVAAFMGASSSRQKPSWAKRSLRTVVKADAGLQKLDGLLQRALQAELDQESTRVRVEVESEVTKVVQSELRGQLKGFASAEKKVAKRLYSLEEMKQNGVDAAQFLNPRDSTLDFLKTVIVGVVALGGSVFILAAKPGPGVVLFMTLLGLSVLFVDQVINRGFGELLLLDSLGRAVSKDYPARVACHEAGHFLVAYLLGILPKAYTLSAWEAFSKYNSMSVQAGTVFLDQAIQSEMQSGQVSGKTLDNFVCVALGGIAAEYVTFGQANGGMSDLIQLEALFEALKFDQQQTNVQLRTSVMNTVAILKEKQKAHAALVDAMSRGESIGRCIEIIEQSL
ncbi:AN1-type zinc finger protein 2A [Durusdinium trenchii]|uniref:AN1-type zinc finger protein 2A n=1 Tax=Durusdinium trenchii TaxID=1381693 RepID=A0ABP0Q1C5_9DINO